MFELVPSQLMRDFYNEIGFEFTDFQNATLIWNAPNKTRKERLDALRELAETTEDENTKKQIWERIDFEERVLATFMKNPSFKYVYVVVDNEDDGSCGFFAHYNMAIEYAINYAEKYETTCSIRKQLIVMTEEDKIVRNPWRGNPNLHAEENEYDEYEGNAIAELTLNANGEIQSLLSNEIAIEEESMADAFRTDRFEYQFIKVPFHLQIGSPVKDVTNDTYGILAQGKEDWEKYLKQIEHGKLYVDYSDIQVMVYNLTESGYWSHEHVNPMHLEIELPPYIQEDEKSNALRHAMEAFGEYLSHKNKGIEYNPELVLKYAKEYATTCLEKTPWDTQVEEANKPEDIMW